MRPTPSNANNLEWSEDVNNLQGDQNYSDDHNPLKWQTTCKQDESSNRVSNAIGDRKSQ